MPDDAGADAYYDANDDADDANHDADNANDAVTNGAGTAAAKSYAAWAGDAGRSVIANARPIYR